MSWYSGIINLLYKPLCPICQRSAQTVFCVDCDRQIQACQNSAFSQELIDQKILLYCWGNYEQALKQALEACKYKNAPQIAEELGKKIGTVWLQNAKKLNLPANIALLPIPLHSEKLKSRGFNQAERLASGFSDRTQISCQPHLLSRIKNTQPQFKMSGIQARAENLKNAFIAQKSNLKGVILIDDIYTTGTTIREAIAALNQVKTPVIAVVVLARPRFEKKTKLI
jgi:ComF family protein